MSLPLLSFGGMILSPPVTLPSRSVFINNLHSSLFDVCIPRRKTCVAIPPWHFSQAVCFRRYFPTLALDCFEAFFGWHWPNPLPTSRLLFPPTPDRTDLARNSANFVHLASFGSLSFLAVRFFFRWPKICNNGPTLLVPPPSPPQTLFILTVEIVRSFMSPPPAPQSRPQGPSKLNDRVDNLPCPPNFSSHLRNAVPWLCRCCAPHFPSSCFWSHFSFFFKTRMTNAPSPSHFLCLLNDTPDRWSPTPIII